MNDIIWFSILANISGIDTIMNSAAKYRMYIDEVGNPDLGSSSNPIHRFLSLTGVIFKLDHIDDVVFPEMESLKKRFFGQHPDDPVILHRKDIVNKRDVFSVLSDPETEKQFNSELLNCLRRWDFKVITICIDKKAHKETYSTWIYHPYHYCLEVMLERYIFFLRSTGATGDVLAESRGGKEDKKLKEAFNNLYNKGTHYLEKGYLTQHLTSSQLKVKQKSNNIAGLQLVDLLAHPSWCEILSEQNLFERELGVFSRQIVAILQNKYYQSNGRIAGSGKKFIG
ncbi:DUF3800 domain-containing protein [bacterium]|nr:DUF3800 domain-containing protein [bacterium]